MQALDRAKRLTAALCKLDERRTRIVNKANADHRLGLIAALAEVDDSTLDLVQRGLAMDRQHEHLQYALQIAVDERDEQRRRERGEPAVDTRRSRGEDHHETETLSPPPLPTDLDLGDEDVVVLDDPGAAEAPLPDGYRYPEPGEPAVQLPDGRIVAAG